MIPTRPLRLAFLGGHGHHYLRACLKDASLTIDAVAACPGHDDADASRARFADATWFDSLDQLLSGFKPDVLNIGTTYARQGPFVAAALRAGVPVVCDKPIAGTWDDLTAIDAALREGKAVVATEFDFRSRPCFRAAAEAVRQGRIGTVALATAQKSYRFGSRPDFYRHREDYGSTLLWVASHGIDAVRFVTGQPLADVVAQHGNLTRPDYGQMEDHCAAMFSLANGATALVHADFLRPTAAPTHGDDRLRVMGELGQLEVRDERCVLITHDAAPEDITDSVTPRPLHIELLDAVLGGDATHFGNEASLEMARVLLTTRDAADSGRRLPIDAA